VRERRSKRLFRGQESSIDNITDDEYAGTQELITMQDREGAAKADIIRITPSRLALGIFQRTMQARDKWNLKLGLTGSRYFHTSVHVKRTLGRDVLRVGQIKCNQRGCERLKEGEKDCESQQKEHAAGLTERSRDKGPSRMIRN
jgi:hypothetical protein